MIVLSKMQPIAQLTPLMLSTFIFFDSTHLSLLSFLLRNECQSSMVCDWINKWSLLTCGGYKWQGKLRSDSESVNLCNSNEPLLFSPKNSSVQHQKPLSSTPKTPQFNTSLSPTPPSVHHRSVPHTTQFKTSLISTQIWTKTCWFKHRYLIFSEWRSFRMINQFTPFLIFCFITLTLIIFC